MVLEKSSLLTLQKALDRLEESFKDLPAYNPTIEVEKVEAVLSTVAERMKDNFPYPHPLYAGQMLKPPHPIARLAYTLSLWINPNNHALDGGRASTLMEKEVVAEIAKMFGWSTALGHLCGGGTMANLESLWIAGQSSPGKKIVASEQAHYTHNRICGVLALPFQSVESDKFGRMDIRSLKRLLDEGDVGTVVVTIGTTATGSVDPLSEILKLQSQYNFRIHADAAYGGYFTLTDNLRPETTIEYSLLKEVDSIVIDPHKHGLQPYGCGCVLFRDPSVGRFYKHDSPYTYFTSSEIHLGEISLECSRPGSAAVALWATQQLLPLEKGGEFAKSLSRCREAAKKLFEKVSNDGRFLTAFAPELDILIWAVKAESVSRSSLLAKEIFVQASKEGLHLATADLPIKFFVENFPDMIYDQQRITCFRSCLLKPEHLDWIDHIWQTLDKVTRLTLTK
ncbi:MAG: aspartate aminotransferase family protein [Blastocatellia bacterium]|nr:aspartate aminotransferase family protein [Blastocatellia bacterium]